MNNRKLYNFCKPGKYERKDCVPMHKTRPSPRHVMHFTTITLLLPVLIGPVRLLLPESLEGSSHLFSPRRKTRGDLENSDAPSSVF